MSRVFFSASSFESSNDCHFRRLSAIIFPFRGSLAWVTFAIHLIFIFGLSVTRKSFYQIARLLGGFNLNDLLIPLAIRQAFSHTWHKHKDSGISIFQMHCFWLLKGLYSFEKESFFSNIPWKLKLSFWKPTTSFPFTMSSTSLTFHNKYCFWTY